MPDRSAVLPGGIGLSRLRVYDTAAPDGVVGGTPHVHLCCTEGYVVTGGEGAVQTLTAAGYRETPLRPGAVVWFEPGTVHRLVNGGELTIVVLMQNSGLPEAGDAVLTFPPDVLADPDAYLAAAALPNGGAPGTDVCAAYRRRDLAVIGFQALRAGGPAALAAFHDAAVALRRPLLTRWRQRWSAGAGRAAAGTGEQLDALERGDPGHLGDARVYAVDEPVERGRLGMCGLLDTYPAAS
ncbi:cupin domain-containing protein [Micromonospora sp. ALFpr18c]|uniref:cupin domain-containing protein n=1 Tax=Micromonospora sp. ALFpr18c TaxID=1458665 RepID=UPI00124BB4EB|nr:cupin domain-containing protein [Micromonospora sp. ALFpr18c]KAB1946329.1 cupin domain-containing protein [Micromonospora sp. ALFpr18c]